MPLQTYNQYFEPVRRIPLQDTMQSVADLQGKRTENALRQFQLSEAEKSVGRENALRGAYQRLYGAGTADAQKNALAEIYGLSPEAGTAAETFQRKKSQWAKEDRSLAMSKAYEHLAWVNTDDLETFKSDLQVAGRRLASDLNDTFGANAAPDISMLWEVMANPDENAMKLVKTFQARYAQSLPKYQAKTFEEAVTLKAAGRNPPRPVNPPEIRGKPYKDPETGLWVQPTTRGLRVIKTTGQEETPAQTALNDQRLRVQAAKLRGMSDLASMDDATANNILEDVTTAKRLMEETPGLDQDEALMEARRMTDVKQLARAVPRKKSRWIGNNAEEAVAAVQGMVAAGGSHEEILTALAGKGWSGEEIQTIMNAAGIPAEAPRTAKPTAAAKPQNQAAKTVVKTGTEKGTGRKVVQYSDGTTAYAD